MEKLSLKQPVNIREKQMKYSLSGLILFLLYPFFIFGENNGLYSNYRNDTLAVGNRLTGIKCLVAEGNIYLLSVPDNRNDHVLEFNPDSRIFYLDGLEGNHMRSEINFQNLFDRVLMACINTGFYDRIYMFL